MIGCLLRNSVVDGAPKAELWTDPEGGGQIVRQAHDSLAEPTRERAVTEFEDGGTDLGNGDVELVHHLVDPFSHEVEIGEACGRLQGHTDSEQALHDPVMEVTPNPLSVVEQADRPDTVVQAGVVDGDTRCQSEGFGEGFILVGEAIGSDLVCEIEVAEDLTFRPDGHTEEGLHGRMIRREPITEFMRAEFRQSERRGVRDQEPEDAATRRTRSDGFLFRLTQPNGQELFEARPGLVEDPEGAVACTDQGASLFHQVTEQGWEIDIGLDHQHCVHQATQLFRIADPVIRHDSYRTGAKKPKRAGHLREMNAWVAGAGTMVG